MFDSDYEMTCSVTMNYVSYNLNKIYLTTTILIEFTSTYYDDNNDSFKMLFQLYTYIPVKNIYQPSIVE